VFFGFADYFGIAVAYTGDISVDMDGEAAQRRARADANMSDPLPDMVMLEFYRPSSKSQVLVELPRPENVRPTQHNDLAPASGAAASAAAAVPGGTDNTAMTSSLTTAPTSPSAAANGGNQMGLFAHVSAAKRCFCVGVSWIYIHLPSGCSLYIGVLF